MRLRSSPPEVFYKKGALKIFAKFTGKHLCQNHFFNKVPGLRPATLLKKRLPFFIEHLWWLLLKEAFKVSSKSSLLRENFFYLNELQNYICHENRH